MIYEEQPAPPALAGAVTRLWFLEMPRPRRYEKVLPLPCAHLIVNLSEPYRTFDPSGRPVDVGDAFVAGIRSEYVVNELPFTIRHVGAELTPAGLAAVSSRAATAGGRITGAREVLDGVDDLVRGLRLAPSPAAALAVLAAFLAARRRAWPDRLVVTALATLDVDPDTAIGDLVAQAGVSHRTLLARFRAATGVTPKAYAQVLRFHRLVGALQVGGEAPDWAALAVASGYYDQPEVIRAFRRFTGWTPTEYRRRVAEFGPDEASFVPLEQPPSGGQARS